MKYLLCQFIYIYNHTNSWYSRHLSISVPCTQWPALICGQVWHIFVNIKWSMQCEFNRDLGNGINQSILYTNSSTNNLCDKNPAINKNYSQWPLVYCTSMMHTFPCFVIIFIANLTLEERVKQQNRFIWQPQCHVGSLRITPLTGCKSHL